MDVHDKTTRSRNMSRIQGKDTKPELTIRHALHKLGFRYRLHYKKLPGKPDLVFPKYKAVILVNGCFWHGHDCHLFKWPSTRHEFWKSKIEGTMMRDRKNLEYYNKAGWKTLVVWECALKGKTKKPFHHVIAEIAAWLQFDSLSAEITGKPL